MQKYLFNIQVAFEAVMANLLRSVLTALGIIFGVGAVIAMLAVGNGARQEILKQIELVGVNNIIIEPVLEVDEESSGDGSTKKQAKKFSGGMDLLDAQSISKVIPGVKNVSPEVIFPTYVQRKDQFEKGRLVGVTNAFFDVFNLPLQQGRRFNREQLKSGSPVCIIGYDQRSKFFNKEKAIGKKIKLGGLWFTVIGVLEKQAELETSGASLGIRNYDEDVYVPLNTALLRYKNRSLITKSGLEQAAREDDDDEEQKEVQQNVKRANYNQIDKIVVQLSESTLLKPASEVITRLMLRRHQNVEDYKITVPELLLKQQQETKDIFNIVLGAIAGISLLVGGIGIMNIMLASVWERIREIGVRQAVGAKKEDVISQFLAEAVIISLSGGIIGIVFGILGAYLIESLADISTIVSLTSVLLSFVVAAGVGLVFGIMPARRAANQDIINSLRHE